MIQKSLRIVKKALHYKHKYFPKYVITTCLSTLEDMSALYTKYFRKHVTTVGTNTLEDMSPL